jgi:AcrR family transcriptional regulator
VQASVDDNGHRGRPRDPSIEERVIEAAKQELAENGFEAFSVRSVARRSGVSRPSLLLRWPDRDTLIIETMESISEWPPPNEQATLRDELRAIVRRVVELLDPTSLGIQFRLVADAPRHPELFAAFQDKVMGPAGKRLTTRLERAVAESELPRDTDCRWAADALVGTVLLRSIGSPGLRPLSKTGQERLIDSMLATLTRGHRSSDVISKKQARI